MANIFQSLTLLGIHLGVSLLLCLLFTFVAKSEKRQLLIVYSIFFFLSVAVLYLPRLPFLAGLQYNWQGKTLSFLLTLAFVYFTPYLTPQQAGFTFRINRSVWLPMLLLLVVSIGYRVYVEGIAGRDRNLERLVYQLTMPGLSEEPVFRGILLGLLNLVFVGRKNVLGALMGWGALIQCVQFGVGHAFYYDEAQHLQFYPDGLIVTFILGAFMTYLKEKGESIVPAIIFHNIYNAAIPLMAFFAT